MSTCRSVQAGPDTLDDFLALTCASITHILLICSSFLSLQFHNTHSQKGEKEKEKVVQPDIPLDSDEDPADADLSLMARTKRLAKEAKAADLRRQLAELEDHEDSPVDSDPDHDQAQDHPSKDMGAFVAVAVSIFSLYSFLSELWNLSKGLTSSMFFKT